MKEMEASNTRNDDEDLRGQYADSPDGERSFLSEDELDIPTPDINDAKGYSRSRVPPLFQRWGAIFGLGQKSDDLPFYELQSLRGDGSRSIPLRRKSRGGICSVCLRLLLGIFVAMY